MKRPGTRILWPVFPIVALMLLFAGISWMVFAADTSALDRSAILALRNMADRAGPEWVQESARNVTSLGSVLVVFLIAGTFTGYLLLGGQRRSAILMLVSVLGGLALNDLLKTIFDRPRPDLALPSVDVVTSSFPSGHAALSSAAYLTMAGLFAHLAPTAAARAYVMGAAILFVFLIGMTRIYLGAHYPTDVLAGWCIGSAWALTCWLVAKEHGRPPAENGPQRR